MLYFSDWSIESPEEVNGHRLRILAVPDERIETAKALTAETVPDHYSSPERIQRIFERLGKPEVAKYLRKKMPVTKAIRSGDLGEILATEYIEESTEFSTPVKRLRWKDHREMAMRGEDVIGICPPSGGNPIRFLKTEAKSRVSLAKTTVQEARKALNNDGGLPSEHVLAFLSERLFEMGQFELSDAIDLAQLNRGITIAQVEHMMFVFTGNAPNKLLKTDLESYAGTIPQQAVGLQIEVHQEFIADVYKQVVEGDDS